MKRIAVTKGWGQNAPTIFLTFLMNFPLSENETEAPVQTVNVEAQKPTGVVPEHMKNPNAPKTIPPELYNQVVNYRSRLQASSGTIEL